MSKIWTSAQLTESAEDPRQQKRVWPHECHQSQLLESYGYWSPEHDDEDKVLSKFWIGSQFRQSQSSMVVSKG